jgi:hypothetical protein
MSVAVALMFEGMPDAEDLRKSVVDGQVVISLGSRVLFCFDAKDVGLRNLAVFTLRSLGFAGQRVAAGWDCPRSMWPRCTSGGCGRARLGWSGRPVGRRRWTRPR